MLVEFIVLIIALFWASMTLKPLYILFIFMPLIIGQWIVVFKLILFKAESNEWLYYLKSFILKFLAIFSILISVVLLVHIVTTLALAL